MLLTVQYIRSQLTTHQSVGVECITARFILSFRLHMLSIVILFYHPAQRIRPATLEPEICGQLAPIGFLILKILPHIL